MSTLGVKYSISTIAQILVDGNLFIDMSTSVH